MDIDLDIEPAPICWPAVLALLNRHLRLIDIAAYCNRTEGWAGQLRRGLIHQPGYHEGVILLALVRKYGYEVPRGT